MANSAGRKYGEIYGDLKGAIENGHYLSGSLLPTEMQLMEKYGVSRTTVRRAFSMLKEDGLVHIVQGRGAEVIHGRTREEAPSFLPPYDMTRVEKRGRDKERDSFSSSVVDTMQADDRVAEELHIPPLSSVYRIQRLKLNGNTPFCYVVSYLACEQVPGLEQISGKVLWLSKHLHDQYHVNPLHADEKVTAVAATFLESNLLHVTLGSPLMLVQRTAMYEKNVMEFSESYYRPDYFHIAIHMEGRPEYLQTEDPSAY